MSYISVLLIAFGLAMDSFAVSLSVGGLPQVVGIRPKARLAFHFGIFQSLMTLLGYLLGSTLLPLIAPIDHWIAFALLAFVGSRMIYSAISSESVSYTSNPCKGAMMVMLSVATSIDALAVGLTFAMLGATLITPVIVIGLIAFGLSGIGMLIGTGLGNAFGKKMELTGGILLIGIGIRIVTTHIIG